MRRGTRRSPGRIISGGREGGHSADGSSASSKKHQLQTLNMLHPQATALSLASASQKNPTRTSTPDVTDHMPRGPAPGFVILCKPDKRFGFLPHRPRPPKARISNSITYWVRPAPGMREKTLSHGRKYREAAPTSKAGSHNPTAKRKTNNRKTKQKQGRSCRRF